MTTTQMNPIQFLGTLHARIFLLESNAADVAVVAAVVVDAVANCFDVDADAIAAVAVFGIAAADSADGGALQSASKRGKVLRSALGANGCKS